MIEMVIGSIKVILTILFLLLVIECNLSTKEPISILITSSKRGGILHFSGFMGSLMLNPSASRLDIHLILDDIHMGIFSGCAGINKIFHHITFYKLEELDSTPIGIRLRNETGDIKKFDGAIYKLDMINLLSNASSTIHRLILLDVDLLILEDLGNLWKEPDNNPGKFLYMTNESYSNDGYYTKQSNKQHYLKPYGLSAGVIVADIDKLKENKLSGEKFIERNDEPTDFPDQDIFNTWAYYNSDKVGELPCRWNRRVDSDCWDPKLLTKDAGERGIIHGKKGMFHQTADWLNTEFQEEKKAHSKYSNVFFHFCQTQ